MVWTGEAAGCSAMRPGYVICARRHDLDQAPTSGHRDETLPGLRAVEIRVLGEGRAVATALTALAQQPDASATITRTLFVGLAMIESTAIYCFVVSMILIFANPFWNHVIAHTAGK